MLRDEGFKPKSKVINVMFLNGGVGDHMASLVATDYMLKHYTWITPLIWVPDFLYDFAVHVLPKHARVFTFTAMQTLYDEHKTTKTTAWDGHVSPMKIHCLDYAFLRLCDENPGIGHKNYLQIRPDEIDVNRFNLPSKYVVMTTGYTAKVREFPAHHVNKIVNYIKDKGYQVVFLGQTHTKTGQQHVIQGKFDEQLNLEAGINLIDKTSLLEAAKIMAASEAVLGVDNGLLHVAGCTEVTIIGGFTTVNPELRMPVRHNTLGWNYHAIVPDGNLNCKFCQVQTNFLYGHDYVNCLYKDYKCTEQMTADKFIAVIDDIFEWRGL